MNQNKEACLCCSMQCAYNLDEPAQKMKTSPNSQNQWAGDPPKNGQSSSQNGNQTGSKDASGVSLNKDLFKEHIQVLRNELPQFQNFLKRNKIQTKKSPKSKSGSNQPQTNSSDRSGVQLNICKDNSSGSQEVIEQKDKLPQNLRKFVNKLIKLVQKDSAQSLQLMGELIWSRYEGVREKVFQVYQLLNYSQQILDSLELEFQNRLMNRNIQAEDKDYLTNFLQIYTATLLLVLNQYFQNPYYEQTAGRQKQEKEDSSNRSGKEEEKQNPRKIVHQDSQGSGSR